ncbi:DUF262 domain-containing protein [Schlesneria sp.]|uniref:DUF262 domain-containing protein n=1 Tax=Schlesneria sp. TaxID=2762018 RepID=UPI002EF40A93
MPKKLANIKMSGSARSTDLADILFPSPETIDYQDSILNIPPEQRRLHTETVDYSVDTIVAALRSGAIKIPVFQRRYVWTNAQASRLIESLIIQCPIPVVYLSQGSDEVYQVVDGNQRLNSLLRFLENDFKLTGLTAYPELEGNSFSELDPRFQRHIVNRTVRCLIILKDTHPQVKFDVFERLNSGAVQLTAQELRHGIYHGDAIRLAGECAKSKTFQKLVSVSQNKRMKLEELVIRFWSLAEGYQQYRKPLSAFLNRYCESHRSLNKSDQSRITELFSSTVNEVSSLFGDLAFAVFDENAGVLSRFNAAVYDCQMVGVGTLLERPNRLRLSRKAARERMISLFNNSDFQNMISRATSDDKNVKGRIDAFVKAFDV